MGRPKTARPNPAPRDGKIPNDVLDRVLSAVSIPVDITELAGECLSAMGGAKGFIRKLKSDYENSGVGTPERARLWDSMCRLLHLASQRIAVGDLESMSDADLERMAKSLMHQVGLNGMPINGWIDHPCI